MFIKDIFVISVERIASTEFEIFPCGYVSCALSPEVISWASSNKGMRAIKAALPLLQYDHQHSVDGGLLNAFLSTKGEVSIEELKSEDFSYPHYEGHIATVSPVKEDRGRPRSTHRRTV